MYLQTLSDRRDSEGDGGPPTDNHCDEWALLLAGWHFLVSFLLRPEGEHRKSTSHVFGPGPLKAVASVRRRGRPERECFTASLRGQRLTYSRLLF